MATVREIAKQAGVSKTTVSMVLNNREGVSEVMRKRVQEAMKHLQFLEEARAANEIANVSSSLSAFDFNGLESNGSPVNILVLHPQDLRSSKVFYEIIRGVQAGAALYHVQLTMALNEPELYGDNLHNLYFSDPVLRPNGVLVIGAKLREPVVARALELGIPVVLVGRFSKERGVSSVGRNEEVVSFEAVKHLIDLGHRSIAFVGGSLKYSYTHERLSGYRKAMEVHQLPLNESQIYLGFNEKEGAEMLLSHPEVTGAMFVNELFATRVIPLLNAAGKSVPGDLSVVTFDDTEISRSFSPPLTSVSLPLFQEGFWSVRLIMEQIRQPLIEGCQVTLKASLVTRESCMPPRVICQAA